MRNGIIACMLLLLVGCADFDFSAHPSILNAKKNGPGLPKYLDKRQSIVLINATHTRLLEAQRDALLILGCSNISQAGDSLRGDRPFIMGFVCGIGGETLYVTTDQFTKGSYRIGVVSYNRFPYPEATRFLDCDFRDLLVQLLNDPEYASAP